MSTGLLVAFESLPDTRICPEPAVDIARSGPARWWVDAPARHAMQGGTGTDQHPPMTAMDSTACEPAPARTHARPNPCPAHDPVPADRADPAEPADVPPALLGRVLADPYWTAEVWPWGRRAWLQVDGERASLVLARFSGHGREPGPRVDRARVLLAEAAAAGAFAGLGDAVIVVVVVNCGDVRLDAVDIVRCDGVEIASQAYALRAVVLADAIERLREASPARLAPMLRTARTPATGAAKRALVGRPDPLRLVLRDLRAAYGAPASIVRVPSAVAGFFDDPWLDRLDLP
jgi:hypothetical protein